MEIIDGYDVIVDGVDNFPTRYLLNDATVRLDIPVVSASILGFDGQLSVFKPHDGPCYRCLYPVAAAGRAGAVVRRQRRARRAAGDDGPAAGDRGHQADHRRGRAARSVGCCSTRRSGATFTELKVRRDPECPICSMRPGARSPTRRWACSPTTRRSAPPRARRSARSIMATIKIPPVLRPSVGGEKEVQAGGDDVGEVLRALAEQHPATQSQLFGADGDAQPLRQRVPQRRGRARARRAWTRRSASPTRS